MLQYRRRVRSPLDPDTVHRFLADFTTVNAWDPRAGGAVRVAGEGGVGTRYRCRVSFLGRTVPMTYTVTELVPGARISWEGRHSLGTATDHIDVARGDGGATVVDYLTEYRFDRYAGLLEPLLRRPIGRLVDEAAEGLARSLEGSPVG